MRVLVARALLHQPKLLTQRESSARKLGEEARRGKLGEKAQRESSSVMTDTKLSTSASVVSKAVIHRTSPAARCQS